MQTKSLNIGFVTLWFERGQAHVSRTIREALASSHNIFVFARAGYCWGKKMDPEKTGYWDIPNLTFWNANKISKKALIKWIEENRLDVVIFNEEGDWGLVKACSEKTIPINYLDSYCSAWEKKMKIFDGILCSTQRTFQMLKDIAPSHFISWRVDSALFKPLLEPEEKEFTFFHNAGWGGVGYRKMTPHVVRAFDEISKTNPSFSLLIHSQLELKKYPRKTRKIIKRNQRISFIEKIMPAPGLYHKGKIYVYPTKLEGLGLTILEALSCGLPVITTDAPPMNEFVKDGYNGLLVKVAERKTRHDGIAFPETIVEFDELKEKMLKLASNEDLIRKLSANARTDVLENYNLREFEERCNKAICEIHKKGIHRLHESSLAEALERAFKFVEKEGGRFSKWSLSKQAICAFSKTLFKETEMPSIIELGGGQSTLLWRALMKDAEFKLKVSTFEHHLGWQNKLRQKTQDCENIVICGTKLKQLSDLEWKDIFDNYEEISKLNKWSLMGRLVPDSEAENTRIHNAFYSINTDLFQPCSIDGMIVDGPHGNGRSLAFPLFADILKPNALLLIDDFDHYPFLEYLGKIFNYRILHKSIDGSKRWVLLRLKERCNNIICETHEKAFFN